MSEHEFIKKFTKITLKDVCNDLGLNPSNISSGAVSEENLKRVKNELIKRLATLFQTDCMNSEKMVTFYLYNEILERLENENKVLREMI